MPPVGRYPSDPCPRGVSLALPNSPRPPTPLFPPRPRMALNTDTGVSACRRQITTLPPNPHFLRSRKLHSGPTCLTSRLSSLLIPYASTSGVNATQNYSTLSLFSLAFVLLDFLLFFFCFFSKLLPSLKETKTAPMSLHRGVKLPLQEHFPTR